MPRSRSDAAKPDFRGLWALVRPHRRRVLLVTTLATASTIAVLATPLVVRHLIDAAMSRQPVSTLGSVTAVLIGLYLVKAVLTLQEAAHSAKIGTDIARTLRTSMYRRMRDLPAGDHVAMRSGDISTAFGADAIAAQAGITRLLPDVTRGAIGFSLALGFMYLLAPQLAAIGLSFVLVYWSSSRWLARRVEIREDDAQARSAQLTTQLNSSLGATGILVTQAIRRVGLDIRLVDHRASAVASSRESLSFWLTMQREVLGLMSGSAVALVYGYGLYLFLAGNLTLGSVVACAVFCGRLTAPLATFSNAGNRLTKALTSFSKIARYIDSPAESNAPKQASLHLAIDSPPSLVLTAVEICFPGDSGPPLRYPNLSWHGPGLVVVEGGSGAGKTSLAKLACGLASPTRGQVIVCGVATQRLTRDEIASLCEYVPSDSSLFPASVLRNVTLDDASSDVHAAGILRALGLEPDELARRESEFGGGLSTGQRQRVALARALAGPCPVLLLDEPFANLDAETANQVGHLLQRAATERLVIIFGHTLPLGIQPDHRVSLGSPPSTAIESRNVLNA
jgi:ATP-binding cassette, subfamily B, bacterial